MANPRRPENIYAEVPTMFGISLTRSYQFKSTQVSPAIRFGSFLKQTASIAAFVCCLALCSNPSQGQEPHPLNLHQSIPEAQTIAARQQRPVLVMFTAEWSPAAVPPRKHVITDADAASQLAAWFEGV